MNESDRDERKRKATLKPARNQAPSSQNDAKDTQAAAAKDDKINAASEESFPASDAPAWRGGNAN